MANNNIIAIDSLKQRSIWVYPGMIDVFPQFEYEEALNISELAPKFNGCYATNNSTIAFVTDGKFFVAPYTRVAMRSLCHAGFRQEHFYVPFSNWDYPKFEKDKWISLCEKAHQSYVEDFIDDCVSYCDENHIGTISEETLRNCFEMPSSGVRVKHLCFEVCYYPIINTLSFDTTAAYHIGSFCANNGKVVFVYRNGKTYVAKGYRIINELRAAGYTESSLFVPFSNGEQIQDPIPKARWESITK